jgi:hypothetical protein
MKKYDSRFIEKNNEKKFGGFNKSSLLCTLIE